MKKSYDIHLLHAKNFPREGLKHSVYAIDHFMQFYNVSKTEVFKSAFRLSPGYMITTRSINSVYNVRDINHIYFPRTKH